MDSCRKKWEATGPASAIHEHESSTPFTAGVCHRLLDNKGVLQYSDKKPNILCTQRWCPGTLLLASVFLLQYFFLESYFAPTKYSRIGMSSNSIVSKFSPTPTLSRLVSHSLSTEGLTAQRQRRQERITLRRLHSMMKRRKWPSRRPKWPIKRRFSKKYTRLSTLEAQSQMNTVFIEDDVMGTNEMASPSPLKGFRKRREENHKKIIKRKLDLRLQQVKKDDENGHENQSHKSKIYQKSTIPARKFRRSFWKLNLLRRVIGYISHLKSLLNSATGEQDDDMIFLQTELSSLALTVHP
ncbi:hypothetical protein FHG87_003229 [Trinorchestia longiramus]|nr:hypothetical protein FHG87_003229 [Trinorchestia longiramus]